MELNFELSKFALEVIDVNWKHTAGQWPYEQAIKYYVEIFEAYDIMCS